MESMENPPHSPLSRAFDCGAAAVARIGEWSPRKALVMLLLLNIITIAPLVYGHNASDQPQREDLTDLYLFRDRAQTIVDGDLLYRDTDNATVTPPGINYLLVPPLLLGDTIVAWELWFATFTFLTAAALFFILRTIEPRMAFLGAGLYVTSPFSFFTAISMIQDDTILPLFVALAVLALVHQRHVVTAGWIGLGTAIKMFPLLVAPLLVWSAPDRRTRGQVLGMGAGVVLLIFAPFFLLASTEFMTFLEFYLLGRNPTGVELEGLSMWRFLGLAGLHLPNALNNLALLTALVGILWAVHHGKLAVHNGFSLSFVALFVLYAKLHFGYYLLLLVIVLPWAISDARRMMALIYMGWLGRLSHLGWRGRYDMLGDELGLAGLAAIIILCCLLLAKPIFQNISPTEAFSGTNLRNLQLTAASVILLSIGYAWMKGIDRLALA